MSDIVDCKKRHCNVGQNHPFYGKKHSKATKEKMRLAKLGDKNPIWKGDSVGKHALHAWVTRHKPKPLLCEQCNKRPPLDVTNISGEYIRDLNDWRWLCRGCHMQGDGRLTKLHKIAIVKKNLIKDKNGRFRRRS